MNETPLMKFQTMKCNKPCNCNDHGFGNDCLKHGSVSSCTSGYGEDFRWSKAVALRDRLGVNDEELSDCGANVELVAQFLCDAESDEEILRIAKEYRNWLQTSEPYEPYINDSKAFQSFIEVFIKCHGRIPRPEECVGPELPIVRNRLLALGYSCAALNMPEFAHELYRTAKELHPSMYGS